MTFPGMERFHHLVDQDRERKFWAEIDSAEEDDPRSIREILDQRWAEMIAANDPSAPLPHTFDPVANASYQTVQAGTVHRTVSLDDTVNLDVDADGRIIG